LNLRIPRVVLLAAALTAVLELWLFIYNSGYGYDALEYLIIGRALNGGRALYTFIPSKSWALYVMVAAFLRLPYGGTHLGVSIVVTTIVLAIAAATWLVIRPRFGNAAAAASALLVVVGCVFMELNYLEPEGPVFLSGLIAFALLTPSGEQGQRTGARSRWFLAGVSIGLGMAFKAVAGFYAAAVGAWALSLVLQGRQRLPQVAGHIAALSAGGALSLAVPAAFFWATGRLEPHLEWSYFFPLLHYPASFDWASKLVVKLSWVWLLSALSIAMSLRARHRSRVYGDERVVLLVALGGVALIPLWKTQASHYAFPGAAFLLILSTVIFTRIGAPRSLSMRGLGYRWGIAALATMVASGVAYRPDAVHRLASVNAFAEETAIRSAIERTVPAGEPAIFLSGGTRFYWLGDRLPNWELLNTEVQSSYQFRTHGDELLSAFDDPRLTVVEFDPERVRFDDAGLAESEEGRRLVRAVTCRLQAHFDRRDDVLPWTVFWVRNSTIGARDTAVCAG
jgi:hypothetical protein